MFVVGTAGHIDHGKSALVKALSGIDPDRLPEEKRRGLTIDLGFAWFDLPSGEAVGVVDVPGHEKFVKNMVAGVGGIDAVVFVIAADDGWMPQTAEHLDILTLLDIKTGIVVLSKIDLVDSELLQLQQEDIAGRLKGTFLENAPQIPFSAKTGEGKNEILSSLQRILTRDIKRQSLESPRLYIDRSFIIKGFGTVVTGTLIEGELKIGQELEICPPGQKVRVRGLQTHKQSIETALPGSRVAVSLSGAGKDDAQRGAALVSPGHFKQTSAIGAKISMLPGMKLPLKNNSEVYFLLGTSIAHARTKLFGKKSLGSGEEDFAVFHLDKEICCRIGDRFIVRRLSPPITVGGGVVLDFDFGMIKASKSKQREILNTRQNLDLESIVASELIKNKNLDVARLKINTKYTSRQIDDFLAGARNVVKAGGTLMQKEHLERYREQALKILEEFHGQRPWLIGLSVGEISRKLKLKAADADEIIAYFLSTGEIVQQAGLLRLKSHAPKLKSEQQRLVSRIHTALSASPLSAPLKKDFIVEDPGFEVVIDFLVAGGDLIELKNGILLSQADFQNITEKVISFIKRENKVTASQVKDYLKTTRKYAIPLLEKLDSLDITRRDGDYRYLADNVGS